MTTPGGSLREILAPNRAANGSGGAAERSPTRERNRGQMRTASEILAEIRGRQRQTVRKSEQPATDPAAAHRLQIIAAGGAADQMRTSSGKMPGR